MESLLTLIVMLAIPYAIYRAIKELITHSANLKNQRNNDNWKDPQSR